MVLDYWVGGRGCVAATTLPSCTEESSHATIPKNPEQYTPKCDASLPNKVRSSAPIRPERRSGQRVCQLAKPAALVCNGDDDPVRILHVARVLRWPTPRSTATCSSVSLPSRKI